MKRPITMADYIIAATIAAAVGGCVGYWQHHDAQEQAAWAKDYMQSAQYQTERAEHFKRLGVIR